MSHRRGRAEIGQSPYVSLFTDFHSRPPERRWYAEWTGPREMWAIGTGVRVLYSSDKIDPSDPADPGGQWKGYYHDHEPDTLVYRPRPAAERLLRNGRALDRTYPEWPGDDDDVFWLGSADGYTLRSDDGRERSYDLDGAKGMRGLQLWGFRCPTYIHRFDLLAAPAKGGKEQDCVLWCGPNLTIGWAGIEG